MTVKTCSSGSRPRFPVEGAALVAIVVDSPRSAPGIMARLTAGVMEGGTTENEAEGPLRFETNGTARGLLRPEPFLEGMSGGERGFGEVERDDAASSEGGSGMPASNGGVYPSKSRPAGSASSTCFDGVEGSRGLAGVSVAVRG